MLKVIRCVVFAMELLLSAALHGKTRILVFYKTAGYHHKSIPAGIMAIQQLGVQNNFRVDTTTDAGQFSYANLKKYAAVVFLSTTGNVLSDTQQQAFEKYIKSGKGYVGIHAAADTEYDWPWYGQLVGAYFLQHPKPQEATLDIINRNNPATRHLPARWTRFDEWYSYKNISDKIQVLITIDETSYTGGRNGKYHPVSWYQEFDGGRAFYTALGHTDASFADPLYLRHLLGGINYAIGKNKK